MDENEKKNEEYLDCFPEIEYFLNAHLSSLLNGYNPPKQKEDSKKENTEILDDNFFEDVDKKAKF